MTLHHWFVIDVGTYASHYGVAGHLSLGYDVAWDFQLWSFIRPFSYGIEFHADHHYGPSHSARSLEHRSALCYPYAVPVVMMMTFVPSLWFQMTDPIIDRHILQQQRAAGVVKEE